MRNALVCLLMLAAAASLAGCAGIHRGGAGCGPCGPAGNGPCGNAACGNGACGHGACGNGACGEGDLGYGARRCRACNGDGCNACNGNGVLIGEGGCGEYTGIGQGAPGNSYCHPFVHYRRNAGDSHVYDYQSGPPTAAITYPYYTTRGPRDFLAAQPRDIGP